MLQASRDSVSRGPHATPRSPQLDRKPLGQPLETHVWIMIHTSASSGLDTHRCAHPDAPTSPGCAVASISKLIAPRRSTEAVAVECSVVLMLQPHLASGRSRSPRRACAGWTLHGHLLGRPSLTIGFTSV